MGYVCAVFVGLNKRVCERGLVVSVVVVDVVLFVVIVVYLEEGICQQRV